MIKGGPQIADICFWRLDVVVLTDHNLNHVNYLSYLISCHMLLWRPIDHLDWLSCFVRTFVQMFQLKWFIFLGTAVTCSLSKLTVMNCFDICSNFQKKLRFDRSFLKINMMYEGRSWQICNNLLVSHHICCINLGLRVYPTNICLLSLTR